MLELNVAITTIFRDWGSKATRYVARYLRPT